jgi:fructokinase
MIVVCGEALMDVFPAGDSAQGLQLDARVGGSPFNVALGLARLGQPVAFAGGLSTDALGERLLRALQAEGVQTDRVVRLAAPTPLCLVSVDAQGQPAYAFHGQAAADRLGLPLALQRPLAGCRALQLGSYTLVVEPAAQALRTLVERERKREHDRCLIACDPNVRLTVEPDVARWRAALDWMLGQADLLKISDEDLALLYPGADAQALAAQWLQQRVSLVVLTRGAAGAQAWTRHARASVPAQRCTLVDAVGAGDSFQAALLAWLSEHDALDAVALQRLDDAALHAMLRFAARAAALTCERRGADLPRRAELADRD